MRKWTVLAALILPVAGEAETWRFTWHGANGFEMSGALGFDSVGPDGLVRGGEVDCFVIEGLQDGAVLGRWALGMKTVDTTWVLTFDPGAAGFVVYGEGTPMPQAWNMNGAGTDCGPEGFGFNIGNFAQDLCLHGELLTLSQADPTQPFPAERDDSFVFPDDACRGEELISQADVTFGIKVFSNSRSYLPM
jgi:hypothetical protein